MDQDQKEIQNGMQDFQEVLMELNNGRFVIQCAERLFEVAKAVEANGGKGSVTIKLSIENNEDGTATIAPDVSCKKPYKRSRAQVMHLSEGKLLKDDPRQLKLPGNVRSLDERQRATNGKEN